MEPGMNNISTLQNEPGFIRMLHAYRQLYSEAKHTMKIRLWVSIVLALFPLATFLFPVLAKIEWTIVLPIVITSFAFPYFIKSIEKKKIEKASVIQEQHDTELFGISWNESVAGHRALTEEIISADKRFIGERKKDWYEDVSATLPPENAALWCQRQNLSWDYQMREEYSRQFVWIFTATLLIPMAGAAWANLPTRDYLVKILMPTLPLLILCIENYRAHRNLAEKQEMKAQEIETILYNNLPVTVEMIRKNQDAIYKFRQETMLVPDDYAEAWRRRNRQNNSTN